MKTYVPLRFGFSIFCLLWNAVTLASPVLDDQYSYKGFVAVVLNAAKEPVYGEQVEGELVSLLRSNARFEFSDQGYVALKERLKKMDIPSIGEPQEEKFKFLNGPFRELYELGVRAVIVGEVNHDGPEYQLHFSLLTTANLELISSHSIRVENIHSLENFTAAAKQAFPELLQKIPFDATVLRRDGYLVVFDRGTNVFKQGTQVPAFTLERRDGKILFEETGLIGITQVEETLSFGKVMVEKRPHEIARGNKIRLSEAPIADVASLLDSAESRSPAALFENEFEVSKGKLGYLNVDLGTALLTLNNTKPNGTEFHTNKVVPGGTFYGELWLTSKYFLDLGFSYGVASVVNKPQGSSADSVGMSVTGMRAQMGYRLNLAAPHAGPVIHFKLGYGTQSFSISSEREPVLFTSATYSGPMIGSGIRFPFNDKVGLGLDIDTLIFPSVSETPVKNGADIKNVSAWNFTLKGYYNYRTDLDLVGKIFFQRNGADFAGGSTRSNTADVLASASQSSKGLLFGLAYYY